MTRSRLPRASEPPPGFGVRPPLRRFAVALSIPETFPPLTYTSTLFPGSGWMTWILG